jgi:uncharacterized FAD-dependent dehydrogenase
MNNTTCDFLIVGMGPAGLGLALELSSKLKKAKIILVDKGKDINNQVCPILDNKTCISQLPCNIISGLGGASTHAGGKLSLYPAGQSISSINTNLKFIEDSIKESFSIFNKKIPLKFTGQINKSTSEKIQSLGFNYKPYLAYQYSQSDIKQFYLELKNELESKGIKFIFNSELIKVREGNHYNCEFKLGKESYLITTEKLILATGREGKIKLNNILSEIIQPNSINKIELGIRFEIPKGCYPLLSSQENDLKIKWKNFKTFCSSKNGEIALYYLNGKLFTEGHEDFKNVTKYSNFSILQKFEDPKEILDIQEELFKNRKNKNIIFQSYESFVNDSTPLFTRSAGYKNISAGKIIDYYPKFAFEEIKNEVQNFFRNFIKTNNPGDINLYFPEFNFGFHSFITEPDFSVKKNLYLIGEGTGKFLGILQSFASGLMCGKEMLNAK